MLTSHNLVFSGSGMDSFLQMVGLKRLLITFLLLYVLCLTRGPLIHSSSTLTGLPSFSIPFRNNHALFPNHLLSCPYPIQRPLAFLEDPLPKIGGPMYGLSLVPSFPRPPCSLFFIFSMGLLGPSCPYLVG